ncbi:hypothetical protein ABG768_014724 [Culter alburnus]|uniref:Armadillo-like helical domain-containing protein 4 n=1 Tax=Culter alburnus TaxID=194366 RepID=A0AAW1Z9E4_CULAL
MLTGATFQSLLLAAVCLASRAATLERTVRLLETLDLPGGDEKDSVSSLLKDRTDTVTRTHSIDSPLLTISLQNPQTAQTSAPNVHEEEDEEDGVRIHEGFGRATADGNEDRLNERQTYDGSRNTTESADGASLPWSLTTPPIAVLLRTDTLQLGASNEDRRLNADTITSSPSDAPTANPTSITSGDSTGPTLLDTADTWTEPVHLRAEEVSVLPSSQEVSTEATMSSEDLPLIFEPFEDVTPPGGSVSSSEVSVAMAPAAVTAGDTELEQMVSMDTERTSSDVRLSGTSGAERSRASVTESDPSEKPKQNDDVTQSSVTHQPLMVVHVAASKPKTDTEDLETKEEPDEDEEDEEMDSDEEEEESEEDLMESTMAPHTRPPYSLIPPPPVWVQRNQGLVRSWVELIREKAGYVSGMLAPVGIGIAGALLLVGALYSIRLIHRKRRDSFKHQRRKPPREVRSGPDNAMLLADSSEDEF